MIPGYVYEEIKEKHTAKTCNNCIHELVCEAKKAALDAVAAHFMRQQNGGMNGITPINDGIKSVLGESCVYWLKGTK